MLPPNIWSTIRDEDRNVTYRVLAYRSLSREELVLQVRQYHAQLARRRRKPPRNQTVQIHTIIGATDR
jgi:hypothetical protein